MWTYSQTPDHKISMAVNNCLASTLALHSMESYYVLGIELGMSWSTEYTDIGISPKDMGPGSLKKDHISIMLSLSLTTAVIIISWALTKMRFSIALYLLIH